ncbi:MAG: hypothetical protein AAFY54_01895 [Cyanobacteria bacterium J06648_10]
MTYNPTAENIFVPTPENINLSLLREATKQRLAAATDEHDQIGQQIATLDESLSSAEFLVKVEPLTKQSYMLHGEIKGLKLALGMASYE